VKLLSDSELAEMFDVPIGKLHELRKRHKWPHVRLGRFEFRFTEEQVRDIVASQTVTGSPALKGTAAGLTSRSAARSA
jgi:hypothetical protein